MCLQKNQSSEHHCHSSVVSSATMSEVSIPLLAPIDADVLLSKGLAGPVTRTGVRRLHKRRLDSSSEEENATIPLCDVMGPDADIYMAYAELPADIFSEATLRHIGFEASVAALLWQRWVDWPTDPSQPSREVDDEIQGMPFIDFATGYVKGRHIDADGESDTEWFDCLGSCGVDQATQQAIMSPIYRRIRLTESCVYWICDTMTTRFETLKMVQRASHERAMAMARSRSRQSASTSQVESSTGGQSRSVSETQRQQRYMQQSTALSASTLGAQHAPGHTVLYTGLSQWRIRGTINTLAHTVLPRLTTTIDLFDQNNRVIPARMRELRSPPLTDFSRNSAFYFAIDRYMALYYANYAKHRDGVGSVVIIHIAIPNSATERLDATERQTLYWPDPNWREVVWNSRRGDALPRRLSRFAVATLIIGTVASKPQSVYNRLDSPDLITERFVLKNRDGRNAVQYVFLEREGEEFLKEHGCRALTVFGLTAAENAEWEERERLSSN